MKTSTRMERALVTALCTTLYAGHAHGLVYGDEATSISESVWIEAFESVNATGEVTLPGFNTSVPYPGSPSDDWVLSIKVEADVPLGEDGEFFTGATLQLKAPDNLLEDTDADGAQVPLDPSWLLCQNFWISRFMNSDDDTVSPDCKGTSITNTCISDLQAMYTSRFASALPEERCKLLSVPGSCAGVLDDNIGGQPDGFSQVYNNSQAGLNGTSDIVRYGFGSHDAGDVGDYDDAIRQIWVAVMVWGSTDPEAAEPQGSVRCLRASNIQAGSRTLANAGSVVGTGFAWWAALVSAVAVAMAL